MFKAVTFVEFASCRTEEIVIELFPCFRCFQKFHLFFISFSRLQERLFIADLRRLFNNCFKFNAPNTLYYKAGYELAELARKLCQRAFPRSDIFPELPDAKPEI